MRQQWGEGGRSTALLKTHLADVLVDKGEWAEASVLYAGATETYEAFYGAEHPQTRGVAIKLARCYGELARLDSAESVMAKYRVSLGDVKDAGLVKAVVASKLNEFAAATEKSIGEAVAEEEWVQVADVRLPPPEKLRGDVSSHVEEGQLRNEEKWDVATVDGSAHNALTPCLG
jgi:hypothetical protein